MKILFPGTKQSYHSKYVRYGYLVYETIKNSIVTQSLFAVANAKTR
jgi:hypothetical protein